MGKASLADKMRIQTLREQRFAVKAIMAAYPDKGWGLSTEKKICQRVDQTGSATKRKAGCGRPKSARSEASIAAVIFNAENRQVVMLKVYNFIFFQQNRISLRS